MNSISLELAAMTQSPLSGLGLQSGGSLISLLQGGGLAQALGGAASLGGVSMGYQAQALQSMLVQSLMQSFTSLGGIWSSLAGGGMGQLGGLGGLGGGLGSLGGLGGGLGSLGGLGGGLGSLGGLGGGLGSLGGLGGGLGSMLGLGGLGSLGSMLGGLGSLGGGVSGFGGLGLLGGLGIPGFSPGLQGFGGLTLPPLPGQGANGPTGFGGIELPPLNGGGTNDGGGVYTPGTGATDAPQINTNINYQNLTTQQRNQLSGMTEEQRAALHLWGIQMTASGKQDGGVLLNVLHHPEQFKPAEVAVAKKLAAEDQAKYGGITGKSLDQAFFGVYQQLTGKDISQRYGNSPIHFATGEVNLANRQTGNDGLSQFDNEVLQLWGHSPLFTGGKIDGSILQYALDSPNTLEANLNKGDLQTLLNADKASDGVVNGDSLENSFLNVLDHVYNGGPDASAQRTMSDALNDASLRRQGLLPPADPRSVANTSEMNIYAQIFGSNDPSICPFLNGGGGAARAA